jgi:peptide chain release factor subunit 1
MARQTSGAGAMLDALIDRLAAFEPAGFPVLSLYLDARSNERGRERFDAFVRKELAARARTYAERSPERESFEADAARIQEWLGAEARVSANGIAIFACSGAGGFFEAVQLEAPLDASELFVGDQPHVYPLARLHDRYPRYAAVVADTDTARIFVIGLGAVQARGAIESPRFRRTSAGGWSQARYQRHIDNFRIQHVKEVVDALDRVVRDEGVDKIVLAGDEVVVPLLRGQLPAHLAARVVDVLSLATDAPEGDVLRQTMDAIRRQGAGDDAELVRRAVEGYRGGGLGVVGAAATRAALDNGQVHELLITATPDRVDAEGGAGAAEELVKLARQTSAKVTVIQDATLLADAGGVAALLRYRLASGRAA